jgi:methionine aminotransferase
MLIDGCITVFLVWKYSILQAGKLDIWSHHDERKKKVHQFLQFFSVNSICQLAISEYLDVVSVNAIKLILPTKLL